MITARLSAALKAGLQVRPAVSADQHKIADLIFFEPRVHRHLDWRGPLEWLGYPPYFVTEEDGRVTSALACPPDPDSIAWIRLFVQASHLNGPSAWPPLWEAARGDLLARGGGTVAAIATQRWFESLLLLSGFTLCQHIVLLEWLERSILPVPRPAGIVIRKMSVDDLPRVVEVDAAAFEPLWHNSLSALSKAFSQAVYATVAEDASGVIGYQLSTANPFGAHLARLAVWPEAQGRGLGAALVRDLILKLNERNSLSRITVNTQSNNAASLALYHRLGFRRTGEQFPVYTCRVEPA
ncbi:MAG: GNAT family N-acetyltransferase [Chloroflexi bacterium]|nr:GNAT family N-acetyltransferase [Chloroflexota bacterium]